MLAGLTEENLRDWRGEGTTVPPRLEVSTDDMGSYPRVQWCGFTATRPWRCGCQGTVATVLIEKPTSGDFLPLLDGGFAMQYSPLMQYREGAGMVLFCQLDVTGRTENDPAATQLVSNLLGYVSTWKSTPSYKVLYAGEAAGKAHLEHANFAPVEYRGGPLAADQLLVVGPGGGTELAASAKDIEMWLKAGGRLVAVGLGEEEANAFLPCKIATKKAKYTCGSYSVPSLKGPFAGIAPADLYNRDPRELPLVTTSSATSLGDGVLFKAESANVIYCQLVPWQFDYENKYNVKTTFQRTSFALNRILANLQARAETPLLTNLGNPLPGSSMLEDVPDVVWLEAGEKTVFLPKVWKGQWFGSAELPKDWEKPDFDHSKWRDVKVPGDWQNQFKDLANVNGVFLYRTAIDVPADMAGEEVTLVLGVVDDEDTTYVNGQLVGSINQKTNPNDYYSAVRRYKLPGGLLKPGPNIVAVNNNDLRGTGGMKASLLKRKGGGSTRWLSGLYLDKPVALDDPYRYYRW
jgi:beta-galactosidase